MDIYEKVLKKLLHESTKLNKLPDAQVLKPPYVLVDENGFNHYIVKCIGETFFVQDPVSKHSFPAILSPVKPNQISPNLAVDGPNQTA